MVRWHDQVVALIDERGIETVIGAHMNAGFDPETGKYGIVRGTSGPATVVAETRDFWKAGIDAVRAQLASGTAPEDVPDMLVEKGALSDRVIGYTPDAARIWFQRLTSYALTGE